MEGDNHDQNRIHKADSIYKIADLGLSRFSKYYMWEDIEEGDAKYLAPELLNDIYS